MSLRGAKRRSNLIASVSHNVIANNVIANEVKQPQGVKQSHEIASAAPGNDTIANDVIANAVKQSQKE